MKRPALQTQVVQRRNGRQRSQVVEMAVVLEIDFDESGVSRKRGQDLDARFPETQVNEFVEVRHERNIMQVLALHVDVLEPDQIAQRTADESVHLCSALLDGVVIGHCELKDGVDERGCPISVIRCVFVHAAYRGRGLAREMLQGAMSRSPHTRFRLSVYRDNRPALRLYGSLGFTQVSEGERGGRAWLVMDL